MEKNNSYIELKDNTNSFAKIKYETDKITFELNTKSIYGLGERYGNLNLLDYYGTYKIINDHKYGDRAIMSIPVIYTDNGLCIYFASPYKTKMIFEEKDGIAYVSYYNFDKGFDIYIIKENSTLEAVKKYYELVGKPPLPPKWLFGYIQSKYGYYSQQETLDIAKKFVALDLPATGIVLDLYWFKYMGDIDWAQKTFPDPKNFIKELNTLGFELINISEPFFDRYSKNHKIFKDFGFFGKKDNSYMQLSSWWGTGGIFDYTNEQANKLLWNNSYKKLIEIGVGGLWTDLGEPEGVPENTIFKLGKEDDIHNLYNYYWSKMLYTNFTNDFPLKRPVILSRSGFSTSPRFGVSVWSGDSNASFSGLEIQPALMISSSLSGFSFWASDVGGFVGDSTPKLYTKWSEFGLFSPIYRPHGGKVDREPWVFGEDTLKNVTKLLKLRAKFQPYIYSNAYLTSNYGIPFIKPVMFTDSNIALEIKQEIENNSYFFGESILYRQSYNNYNYSVYLPISGEWVEMQSFKSYIGNVLHKINFIDGNPPYFLKPNGVFIENSKASYKEFDTMEIYINNRSEGVGSFLYYDDDGISTNYKNGSYDLLEIKNSFENGKIIIEINPIKTDFNKNKLPNLEFNIFIPQTIGNIVTTDEFDTKNSIYKFKMKYPENQKRFTLDLKK